MEEGENILENLQKDRKGLLYYIKKYFLFGMLILLIMIFFVLVFYMNDEKVTEVLSCGDGTFYSTCSLNKPYYCSDGILIKDAVSCGCPDALDKIDTTCTSNYYKEEINIPLNLNLRNEEKEINFKFYQKVLNYLDTLPKMIFYPVGEIPRRDDFKLMKIDDPIQREALMPLVTEIQNMAPDSTLDQARIAINLVQNIPYGEPEFASVFGGKYQVRLSKYPYQTLFDNRASCEGKSELLAFLLREIGYGVSLFYYAEENHEAVGIKCPVEHSLDGTGYCFVETTVPAPITYSTGTYLGIDGGKLHSKPEVVLISKGFSLPENIVEYDEAEYLKLLFSTGGSAPLQKFLFKNKIKKVEEKYSITGNFVLE